MNKDKYKQKVNLLNIITTSSPIGGAQMVLKENVLNNSFNNFVVIGNEGILTKELRKKGVEVIILKNLKRHFSFYDISVLFEIIRIIKSKDIDFVMSHSSKIGVLGRLASFFTNKRNAFVVHGWSFSNNKSILASWIYLLIERIMKPFSDYIILVSKYDQRLGHKHNLLSNKNTLIYNGSRDLLKNKVKVKSNTKITLSFVARFSYQKDHETLFQALSNLKKSDLNKITINLIGGGNLMGTYIARSQELGIHKSLNFVGETPDVDKYLLESDLFMLISNYEGLPVSIIEAMSVGLPVIASDVGGINELVENGVNGYLVKKNDFLRLSEVLIEIINKNSFDLKSMGNSSRELFQKNFSVNFMTTKTEEIILKILKK